MPYLAAAVTRFLQEYPWTTDGLSRTERRLLQLAAAGRTDLTAAFPRMQDGEDAYYITDSSLAALVENLSHMTPPLLTVAPGSERQRAASGAVTLTDIGRAVLSGQRDRVVTFGIDRWLGGVHLQGDGTSGAGTTSASGSRDSETRERMIAAIFRDRTGSPHRAIWIA